MTFLVGLIGVVGLASLLFIMLILARLTQKWELVTKFTSYYRLFYLSSALIGIAILTRLIRVGYLGTNTGPQFLRDPQSLFYLVFYHLPVAIGVTISLGVTWKSWGWLLGESRS